MAKRSWHYLCDRWFQRFEWSPNQVTQVHIQKPKGQIFVVDYYFFKSKFYSLQMQVVVDHEKQFCDVFVGMLWSMNDSKFWDFQLFTIKWPTKIYSTLNVVRKAWNHTLLGTRGSPSCLGWSFHTSKLECDI